MKNNWVLHAAFNPVNQKPPLDESILGRSAVTPANAFTFQ